MAKAAWKKAEGVLPVSIMYGPLIRIEQGFLMDYFYLLTQRTFDAILVFDAY